MGLKHVVNDNKEYVYIPGQPNIMATEVNPVDDKYKEKKIRNGHSTPLLDLNKRKVTQEDIDNLGLDKLEYDNEGKSKLGKLTNIYHE